MKIRRSKNTYLGTGKRKNAIAQVTLFKKPTKLQYLVHSPNAKKTLTIEEYFPRFDLCHLVNLPFFLTKTKESFSLKVKLKGGGFASQAAATSLGIARALTKVSPKYTNILKTEQLLTRDARKKERKKYGLKKARKAPQFSKR